MKSLVDFIKENLNIQTNNTEEMNESDSDYKFITFKFGKEDSAAADDLKSVCSSADIYCEPVDDTTIKVKIKKGKDVSDIESSINDYIDGISDDKKSDLESVINGLKSAIEKMNSFVSEEDTDKDDADEKKDDEDSDKQPKDDADKKEEE